MQLSFGEREKISVFKAMGKSLREIARLIGKDVSTVSRELKRNGGRAAKRSYYLASRAHEKAKRRKSLAAKRGRLKDPKIRGYVKEKIKLHWSPEQISGRISIDFPELRISHEAIYQFIYAEAWELIPCLPRKHKRRRMRIRMGRPGQLAIPSRVFIGERPEEINQRLALGHWEADSLISRANSVSLHILLERKTRLVKITKMLRNSSRWVRDTILRRLTPLPSSFRLSLTYDNGTENFEHLEINQELKTQSYFCNPYHSWEKGSVENAIGLVRRFIPKRTNLERIPASEISRIENLLNNRPRKCLNYRTPKEVFKSLSVAITGLI